MSARVWGALRAESGQSLVLAIVVVGALTISTAGVVTYMTSNESSFNRTRDDNRALEVAEAGLQYGISILSQYDKTLTKNVNAVLPKTTYTFDGGNGFYQAKKIYHNDPNHLDAWTVTATGTSPNGRVTRTVQQGAQAAIQYFPGSPVYNYALYVSGDPNSCTSISGSATAGGNVWVGNDLCMSGTASLIPPADNQYTLYVGGKYKGGNNQALGSTAARFHEASIVQGCFNGNNQVVCSNNTGQQKTQSGVFAYTCPGCSPAYNGYDSISQTGIKPTVDPAAIYALGDWRNPVPSGCGFTFEQNAVRSNHPNNTVSLDSGNYNCTVNDSFGNLVGSLAYSTATNTLTINGTIFIDANVNLTTNPGFKYAGTGTIYVNGTVNSKTDVCGPPTTPSGNSCSGGPWAQSTGTLEMVAMNVASCPPNTAACDPSSVGWTSTGNGELDMIVFIVGALDASGNGGKTDNFKGPIIADSASINGGAGFAYPVPPPSTAPGAPTVGSAWSVVPSSWRQLTN